jgi:N-acetylneuraminic acid mutarotase
MTPNTWTKPFAQYPIVVAEPAGDMIDNNMVIFGGFQNGYTTATNATYALDLSEPTAVWKKMDNMPTINGITHQSIALVGTKAYMCGGYIGGSKGLHTDKCFVYDHSKPPGSGKQWSTITQLPMVGRAGGAMIYDSSLNALIYAGGAQRNTKGTTLAIDFKDTWMYSFNNPGAGWVPQSKIPYFANHMNAVTVVDSTGKERHYVFGGQVGDYELTGNVATMYEYVAITDTWIKRTPMPFGRGHATSAVRAVGCGFIVAGGRTNKDVMGGLTGEVTYYDVATDTWQSIGRLPVDIHTNVCVVSKTGLLRCETGWIANDFSTETQLIL